jgi:hypothetical protein
MRVGVARDARPPVRALARAHEAAARRPVARVIARGDAVADLIGYAGGGSGGVRDHRHRRVDRGERGKYVAADVRVRRVEPRLRRRWGRRSFACVGPAFRGARPLRARRTIRVVGACFLVDHVRRARGAARRAAVPGPVGAQLAAPGRLDGAAARTRAPPAASATTQPRTAAIPGRIMSCSSFTDRASWVPWTRSLAFARELAVRRGAAGRAAPRSPRERGTRRLACLSFCRCSSVILGVTRSLRLAARWRTRGSAVVRREAGGADYLRGSVRARATRATPEHVSGSTSTSRAEARGSDAHARRLQRAPYDLVAAERRVSATAIQTVGGKGLRRLPHGHGPRISDCPSCAAAVEGYTGSGSPAKRCVRIAPFRPDSTLEKPRPAPPSASALRLTSRRKA